MDAQSVDINERVGQQVNSCSSLLSLKASPPLIVQADLRVTEATAVVEDANPQFYSWKIAGFAGLVLPSQYLGNAETVVVLSKETLDPDDAEQILHKAKQTKQICSFLQT